MTEMWMPGAEQRPQAGGVAMNTSLPSRVTWHITWDALTNGQQPSFDGVAGYLERMGYCPTLMWDPWTGRIVQFYPADQGGRALVNWNQDGRYNIQIETFFSPGAVRDGVTYQTVADTPCNGLAEILAWTDSLGIPRVWPMGAPQWTGNSRDPGIWNSEAGHYGHCNVPDNTHTDPGPMPDLNGGIAAMGSITPEEDMPLTDDDIKRIADAVHTRQAKRPDGGVNTLEWSLGAESQRTEGIISRSGEASAKATLNTQVPRPGGGTNTLAWSLGAEKERFEGIGATVLNQAFKLADGTVTNLAGILTAINAKPVSGAAAGPVSTDVQAVADAVVSTFSKQLGK